MHATKMRIACHVPTTAYICYFERLFPDCIAHGFKMLVCYMISIPTLMLHDMQGVPRQRGTVKVSIFAFVFSIADALQSLQSQIRLGRATPASIALHVKSCPRGYR